jgi:branched-chain amino acid transport system permease protein
LGVELAQAIVNGLLSGALIAVPALGFTTIFAVLRFPDFAVAAYATVGAFAGWEVNAWLGEDGGVLPVLVAAFVVAGLLGVAAEWVALKPLRGAGALRGDRLDRVEPGAGERGPLCVWQRVAGL